MGDPQQLPATVKSAKGRELELERSLFERLQRAGCPVKMLSMQYRMHPAIRKFPSDYFYGGRLEDGWGTSLACIVWPVAHSPTTQNCCAGSLWPHFCVPALPVQCQVMHGSIPCNHNDLIK